MFTVFARAQEPQTSADPNKRWTNESEVAVIVTSGNTETESYSAKQKTGYTFDQNVVVGSGSYLRQRSAGVETAKNWDANLRYERILSDKWSVFLQVGAESNPYSDIIQRDNQDLGGKYFFDKRENNEFFGEFGARASKTYSSTGVVNETHGRLYIEYNHPFSETVQARLWTEYIHNFSKQMANRVSAEPSLYVALNRIFSMKLAYLVKKDQAAVPPTKEIDATTTVSLVAKF